MSFEAVAVAPGSADRTTVTLRALRRMRRGHLRERASDTAYVVYMSVLALAIYGGGVYHRLSALASDGGAPADHARILLAAAPALVAVHLLVLLAVCRDAIWRGPVTLSPPAISWLLPLPIDRGRVVRPRFRVSMVAAVAGGAALGVLEALVLGATAGIPVPRLLGAATGAAALLGLLAGGLSGLVVRYPAAARAVRVASLPVTAVAIGLAATADLAWSGRSVGALTIAAGWSGPWGWAAQPLLAAAGHPRWSGPANAAGVLALAAAGLTAVAAADRAAAAISSHTLRSRSNAMSRLTGSAMMLDPRGFALTARSARAAAQADQRERAGSGGRAGQGGRAGRVAVWARPGAWRMPHPRRAWLAIPWRDATALLRDPSRTAWAAAMTCAAYLLGALASDASRGVVAVVAVAGALTAGYLAATQLTEPARIDADDPRRAANLPYPFDRLALRHAVVPTAVLAVLGLAAAAVTAAVGGSPAGFGLTLLAAPALAAGALVSAHRGPIPGALWVGVETPVGNTAGQQILVWYFAAPVVTVVLLLAPATDLLLGRATPGRWVRDIVWGLGLTGLLLLWTSRRAAKLRRP